MPVVGHDVHQVAVGPVHAGVIESGHFRFHVVGERIIQLDLRLFYKRRGLEVAAAGRPLAEAIAHAQRACAACAVTNTVAYAQACEAALGLEPERELRRCRTLLLELERVYNHLHDISAICAGVGFAPGTMAYAALKERAQRLNQRLTGHRFLFGTVRVASSELALTAGDVAHARAELRAVRDEHATTWRQLQFVVSLQQRLADVGVLTREAAERLGAVGPTARAAGLRHDVRSQSPRLWYGEFRPVTPRCQRGCRQPHDPAGARARAVPRAARRAAAPPAATGPRPRRHRRGQHRHRARRKPPGDDDLPHRARRRTPGRAAPSHRLLRELAGARPRRPGNLVPDFPLINKSFELCYACVDR